MLLDGNWNDDPYTFYFHPKNSEGTREVNETFDMDYNHYFNPFQLFNSLRWNGKSWQEWQAFGMTNIQFMQTLCSGTLRIMNSENSPAFQIGFKSINIKLAREAGNNAGPEY